jgi:hypothetical protein
MNPEALLRTAERANLIGITALSETARPTGPNTVFGLLLSARAAEAGWSEPDLPPAMRDRLEGVVVGLWRNDA